LDKDAGDGQENEDDTERDKKGMWLVLHKSIFFKVVGIYTQIHILLSGMDLEHCAL
jgi:hypothetical protein